MGLLQKMGRPYYVADIDLAHDPDLDLYDAFYDACSKMNAKETIALSRTLGVDTRSVRRWQEGKSFPMRRGIAIQVIQWVEEGMPRRLITQTAAAAGML